MAEMPRKCTYCKKADLGEVVSGVLECGHIYCEDCLHRLWHAETAAAGERREARAHLARLHAQTRTQIQAHAREDAVDNGRNLHCPSCQKCSSVDSVRRVYLSSSQAPGTAPTTSPRTLTRTTSASTASAEEVVEDLSAQLAAALEHLDAAHAHAADTARAHDLNMQKLQAQLMGHAEQAHQSQVRELAETNAQLQRELSNAQAQLNHAEREVNEMRVQFGRAVQELSATREHERKAKARVSDAMVKTRDAAVDKLAERLSANGALDAPLRGGTQTPGAAGRPRSTVKLPASPTTSDIRRADDGNTGIGSATSPRFGSRGPALAPEISSRSTGRRRLAPVKLQPESESVSSATRSGRIELGVADPSRTRTPTVSKIEHKPKIEDRAHDLAGRGSDILPEESVSGRHTRASLSTKVTMRESPGRRKTDPAAPALSTDYTRATDPISRDDHNSADKQRTLREKAEAEGRRWPISEKIIVPPCSEDFKHDFKGKGSNQTYLKYKCKECGWGCEERTPDGYIPERQRRVAKSKGV